MNTETLGAWASLATAVVIGASAVAALVQLRHMRAGNQLEALLSLERDFRATEMQSALAYVQEGLDQNLADPAYRRALETIGFVNATKHPELLVCNWCNELGALLKHRFISEDAFMDLFARLIVHCWTRTTPAIAIMRRSRGNSQYHDFEFVAMRAAAWLNRRPSGSFPRALARTPLPDPWLEADRRQAITDRMR